MQELFPYLLVGLWLTIIAIIAINLCVIRPIRRSIIRRQNKIRLAELKLNRW